ncbi:MAG: efflux transporter outer membrane subunit [Sphingomonadales bacterium]|nr:efflux transporter outer membrane subunit [Sphingomonadales bacterium]
MRRLALLLPALALAGCKTVGPDFVTPAAPAAEAGFATQSTPRAEIAKGPGFGWWKAFGSPALDALVDQALARNPGLEASRETLERAHQQVAAAAGRQLPQVDANARIAHSQVNLSAFGLDPSSFGTAGFSNPEFDMFTVGGGVSYDLDLFGRNRRTIEQAGAEAEAQQRKTEAAHLLVAGRVVGQVLAIAAIRDRIAAENTLIDESRRNVTLTEARRRAGEGTLVEVLSAEGQLAADQAGMPQLAQQLAEARAMLAVLLGISPAELGATDFSLDSLTLPAQVPVAMPSEMVHKRPDILEAEAHLHAATAAVGVATAQLYPDITLGATLTQSNRDLGSLLGAGSRGFDLFAGLTAPLFHGGTLTAQKRGAEAAARAAAASYRQTVLDAFGQVSGMLSALDNDARGLAAQQQAADIAQRSLALSRRSFQVGNSGILQVLDASRAWQRARLALVEARARRFTDVARLYVATAGGWTGPVPAATPQ